MHGPGPGCPPCASRYPTGEGLMCSISSVASCIGLLNSLNSLYFILFSHNETKGNRKTSQDINFMSYCPPLLSAFLLRFTSKNHIPSLSSHLCSYAFEVSVAGSQKAGFSLFGFVRVWQRGILPGVLCLFTHTFIVYDASFSKIFGWAK